ncbi:MAG: hypothetical protein A2Y62_01950 [Candidatus Fischerbacteria bacterium RBG_13_37_8]|uniref:Transporter n=1 Tax=Candidatus Fischerbacteria bacterium RBG_13_37_8 TaxID=1817863 RepID=A0A1F5VJR1_9BACT|nr:MAG: hypothetical protein A2Y62_01950 [Candidatus Fischerbacteria bacterium RBG_13_37_8]
MKHVIVLLLCAFISIAALHNTGANEQEHVPIATPVQEKVQGSSGVVAIEGGLRLEDALKLSLQYNRELQIGLEEKNIAKGRTWEAYGEALPTVTMNGSYTRMDEVLSFEFDGMKVDLGFLNNYSTTLNVTQPLYRGGRTGAALRASKLYKALVDANIRSLVIGTLFETEKAYYDTLLAQEQFKVTEKYVKLAEAHAKDVETKRKYGVASNFNVLRSQVELSNARAQMINYRHHFQIALVSLLKTMGVSQDSQVELADQLIYNPVQVNEEEAYRQALINRPDLEGSRLTIKLQKEAVVSAKSNYWPGVDAFINWTLSKPDPHISMIDKWGTAWNAGISFNFTLFDGLRREGSLIRERATLKQYQTRFLDSQEQIKFEVDRALKAITNAAEALEVQKLTLDQANEGLRLAEAGYKEGVLDQVSVLEARAALTQAQLLYYNSLYIHSLAKLELQRATGILKSGQ